MIRLSARRFGNQYAFTVTKDGADLFTTADPDKVAERMLKLGIDNPLHLIDAARHWGVVELREYENPHWRGG